MATREPTCPVCGRPTDPKLRPFCSVRCADRDLLRWLNGGYCIAGSGADADDDGDEAIAARAQSAPLVVDEDE